MIDGVFIDRANWCEQVGPVLPQSRLESCCSEYYCSLVPPQATGVPHW